jgi:Protein of unknown function (DUF2971)
LTESPPVTLTLALYKFYGPARVDVLQNLLICFSSPGQLNDPLEGIPPIKNPIGATELRLISDHSAKVNYKETFIRKLTDKLVSVGKSPRIARKLAAKAAETREARELIDQFPTQLALEVKSIADKILDGNMIEEAVEALGVYSMTETIASGPMWAHYANNYQGFALQFDLESSFFYSPENGNFLPKKVLYQNRQIEGLSDFRGEDVLLTKSVDWAYEKEWRMLVERSASKLTTPSGHSLFAIEASAIS